MQLYLKIASVTFLEIEKFEQYHCLMISHDLRYSWCSWHCKWHENIGVKLTFVQNYHGPLTRKHWRENELKEFVMNVSRWHKIGFGEVSTIIKPYRDLELLPRQIPSVKWTFFKPQFHFCVKLGSQVPNSNLSVTVYQWWVENVQWYFIQKTLSDCRTYKNFQDLSNCFKTFQPQNI